MAILAETYVNISVDADSKYLRQLHQYLEYVAAVSAKERFGYEIEIEVIVQDGSIKGWIKIIGAIYAVTAAYGSFRSGIDFAVNDARSFSEYVIEHLKSDSQLPGDLFYRTERRLGTPGRIQRIYPELDQLAELEGRILESAGERKLEEIQPRLERITRELTFPEDRESFMDSIPHSVSSRLPEPKPNSPKYTTIPKAILREDEFWSISSESELLDRYERPPRLAHLK